MRRASHGIKRRLRGGALKCIAGVSKRSANASVDVVGISKHAMLALGLAMAIAAASLLAGAAAPRAYADESSKFDAASLSIERISGDSAASTSAAEACSAYPDGSDFVVITSASSYKDEISAASLAGGIGCPVLLVENNAFDTSTAIALEYLEPAQVIIVGGTASIGEDVEARLAQYAATARLSGDTSIATNLAVYAYGTKHGLWSGEVILATDASYADVLSIMPYAVARKVPVLLCQGKSLGIDTVAAAKASGVTSYVIVGGTDAVSDLVKVQLGVSKSYIRLAGGNRYETNASIVAWECTERGMSFDGFALATTATFTDAFPGAVCAARSNSVVVIADNGRLSTSLQTIVDNYVQQPDPSFRVLGNIFSVSEKTVNTVAALWNLGGGVPTRVETAAPTSAPVRATVVFAGVSGAGITAAGATGQKVDTLAVGTSSGMIFPESNVLYLPSSSPEILSYTFVPAASGTELPSSASGTEVPSSASGTEVPSSASAGIVAGEGDDDGAAASNAGSPAAGAGATVEVSKPASEEAAHILATGTVDSSGTQVTAQSGETYRLEELLETEKVSGASDVTAQSDETPIEIPVTSETLSGTIDLSLHPSSTDAKGRPYWHLVFAYGAQLRHVYVYRSADAASMYIDTVNGLDWVQQSKDNRDSGGAMSMVASDGAKIIYDGVLAEIKGHGNSTWAYTKKPYQIKLSKKTALIDGAAKAKTYILLANVIDESGIRDEIAYGLAAKYNLGFASAGRTVDLYIDGTYQGSYYLCEKIQVDASRLNIANLEDANEAANPGVDIPAIEPTVLVDTSKTAFSDVSEVSYSQIASPADITGGYLLEMELDARYQDEDAYFRTSRGVNFVIKSPEQASPEEVAYIASYVQDLEDALYSESGYNSQGRHYSEYVDMESLARIYAYQECLANRDGFVSSAYFYKDKDADGVTGKLYAGPVWDMDNSMASTTGTLGLDKAADLYETDLYSMDKHPANWVNRLLSHPEFAKLVADVYSDATDTSGGANAPTLKPLVDGLASSGIDTCAAQVQASRAMDDLRWSIRKANNEAPYDGSVNNEGDWQAAAQAIKAFLQTRAAALEADALFGSYLLPANYHAVKVDPSLAGTVEATSAYAKAGGNASLRDVSSAVAGASGAASANINALHLMATYVENGITKTIPVASSCNNGFYYVEMPDADITITADKFVAPFAIDPVGEQPYTGKAVEPEPTVRDALGNVLARGIDYTLEYSQNIEAGRAYITVLANDADAAGIASSASTAGSASSASAAGDNIVSISFVITRTPIWTRLSGANRYATMQAIVAAGFKRSDTVILATGEKFPDALSASALAGCYGCPILMTASTGLSAETKAAITRLGAKDVIVIGGPAAVSADIVTAIKKISSVKTVSRIYGENAIGTSLAVLDSVAGAEGLSGTSSSAAGSYGASVASNASSSSSSMTGNDMSWGDTVIIATGKGFQDALSISPFAYARRAPILLTDSSGNLTEDEYQAIAGSNFKHAIIVGGTAVVSVETQIKLGQTLEVLRLGGANRYDTSKVIAAWELKQTDALYADNVCVATGDGFADELSAAAYCGSTGNVLLLAADSGSGHACIDSIVWAERKDIVIGHTLGGTAAVSASLEDYIESVAS